MVYLENLDIKSGENLSAKSVYSTETFIKAFIAIKLAIWDLQDGWILLISVVKLRDVMSTTKILYFKSSIVVINCFFSTSLTCLIIGRVF